MSSRLKRPFDVIGAIGGLVFFAPVMAAIAAAILLADGRPLLFRQTRLGRGRRPFTILKFRTMRDENVTADRKSTRLNSSHLGISYAVFCLKKKKKEQKDNTRGKEKAVRHDKESRGRSELDHRRPADHHERDEREQDHGSQTHMKCAG